MSWLAILSIVFVGLILLILEIIVVPGTTLVGAIGLAMMAFGVVISFTDHGTLAGSIMLVGTLVATIAMLAMALRSNTWKGAMLSTEMQGRVNTLEAGKVSPGDAGMTITRLNPMGKAIINNEYYEVTSKDNLIDPNSEIIVTKVEGNKIIVKSKSV